MSERQPVVGPDVPGGESPSPDVLDELLRAFSADPDDVDRLADIDLTSPEVVELLTPPGAPAPAPSEPEAAEPARRGSDTHRADGEYPTLSVETDGGAPAEDGGVAGDPLLGPAAPVDGTVDASGPRTISIVDTGLPDTVYIGGNLEATDVSRATVVIEDRDGDSPTISVEDASTATRIEPRLRDRRIAIRRAAGRKRLKWAAAATAVVVFVVAALAVLGSGLFAVEDVRIEGAEQTTEADLAPIVEELRGTPVLRTDTERIEDMLKALPWVADARVSTQFPDGATVELRERLPAASFQGSDGAWRLIDDTGRVLALSGEAPAGYLTVSGNGYPDVDAGEFAPPGLKGAATLARSLTPAVQARAASIAVTPNGADLRLTFTDGTEIRFGPAEDLVQKLVRLETKLDDLGDERVNYLDVSTNEVGQG